MMRLKLISFFPVTFLICGVIKFLVEEVLWMYFPNVWNVFPWNFIGILCDIAFLVYMMYILYLAYILYMINYRREAGVL